MVELQNLQQKALTVILAHVDPMHQRKRKKSRFSDGSTGINLKTRFMLDWGVFIVLLVSVIFAVLGFILLSITEETLVHSLRKRVAVLLNSMTCDARIYFQERDEIFLDAVIGQISSLDEGVSATITGRNKATGRLDLVLATNSHKLLSTHGFVVGKSTLSHPMVDDVFEEFDALNVEAEKRMGQLAERVRRLEKAAQTGGDTVRAKYNSYLLDADLILGEISFTAEGCTPPFDERNVGKGSPDYVFYKPILYIDSVDTTTYVQGIAFVHVNVEPLLAEIREERLLICKIFVTVLVLSLCAAVFSASLMSGKIVHPIKKLVSYVEMIVGTEEKEKLAGKNITVRSRDEIGLLATSINEMTRNLVKGALLNKNLLFGKYIQMRFIPSEVEDGVPQTTGSLLTGGAEFFSYYAGADELSGDYFDYKKIDDEHYAVIKCDVSGHGVSAALIMVEVATLFLSNFETWNMESESQGLHIAQVIEQINDFLESRQVHGRFASISLCILNTRSGECWICNAGDNRLNVYDGELRKMKTVYLPEAPAAGIFSSSSEAMKGIYKVSKITLKKGDVLFLFTDGLEESKRSFCDDKLMAVPCKVEGLKHGDEHETHKVGDMREEFTTHRIREVIEAVYSKSTCTLHKFHAPKAQSDLTFDFSDCGDSAEDAVMALASAEKLFRMVSTKSYYDITKADHKVDTFLEKHFVEYPQFIPHKKVLKSKPNFVYYNCIKEDSQFDDLTLVAIKKL